MMSKQTTFQEGYSCSTDAEPLCEV